MRYSGARLELSDVHVEPLYPPTLATCSAAEFVARYGEVDAEYQARAVAGQARGDVCDMYRPHRHSCCIRC